MGRKEGQIVSSLLMRLPFNLQIVSSLGDIIGYIQCYDNNNKIGALMIFVLTFSLCDF